ncbi:MAG: ABC transporter permease [Candidatus Binatia bacterium]
MLRALRAALVKDFLLLARDRAAMVFLTIAPVVVISVTGLSLASLYGASPGGATGYVLPFVDEDGGEIGRAVREHLREADAVEVEPLDSRGEALARLHSRDAAVVLIVPAGTGEAIREGRAAELLVYTDPVRHFEVSNLRALVQEIRHALEAEVLSRARHELESIRTEVESARPRLEAGERNFREEIARLGAEIRRRAEASRHRFEREIREALSVARTRNEAAIRRRITRELSPVVGFLDELESRRRAFETWLESVREKAGRYAEDFPAPPEPPAVPPVVASLRRDGADALAGRLLGPLAESIELPPPPSLEIPDMPSPPRSAVPLPARLAEGLVPGPIEIREESATGAARRLNTFDQNVPGFSVTFLLLGLLFGVSLGLLDERDWGTLERLRAMPAPFAATLVSKLVARFLVGLVQMIVLFTAGWMAFGMSVGPEPLALLLPITGIVFAGTTFGLVIAGVATSREAVLPVGSIVIVTMAAVGGCWWPIDLEPRWMRTVALGFPTTWAMSAFNDLMIRRQPLEAALQPTAVLLAYGAAYLVAGLVLFRRHAGAR